jgi:hypothetical protein
MAEHTSFVLPETNEGSLAFAKFQTKTMVRAKADGPTLPTLTFLLWLMQHK